MINLERNLPNFDYEITKENIVLVANIRKQINGIWYKKQIIDRYEIDDDFINNTLPNLKRIIELFMSICRLNVLHSDWDINKNRLVKDYFGNLVQSIKVDDFQLSDVDLFEKDHPSPDYTLFNKP